MRQKKKSRLIKHGDIQITIYPRTGTNNGKGTGNKRKMSRHCQVGSFLNWHDFAYAGRDVVNQVGKVAPEIINQGTGEINKIIQERIDQAIRLGEAEIERVAPKIIKGAIEEVHKTLSDYLAILARNNFKKLRVNCSGKCLF